MSSHVCIVGGAASLYGAKMGKLIDSYPVVIRVNYHPLKGHEEDVGEKVTIGSGHPRYAKSQVDYHGRRMSEQWGTGWKYINKPIQATIWDYDDIHDVIVKPPKAEFLFAVLDEKSKEWEKEIHAHPNPTTGLRTIALALHLYSESIDIIGFGHSDRLEMGSYENCVSDKRLEKSLKIHRKYFDAAGDTILNVRPKQHYWHKERALINLWESHGLLTRLESDRSLPWPVTKKRLWPAKDVT